MNTADHPSQDEPDFLKMFTPQQLDRLLKRTDDLIREIRKKNVTTLLFLDRSARPLSWMLRSTRWWKENPHPQILFMNMGREKLNFAGDRSTMNSEYDEETEEFIYAATPSQKQEIWKKTFTGTEKYQHLLQQAIQAGHLLIVDDWSESGYSLGMAEGFIEDHLPEARYGTDFSTYVFFREEDMKLFSKPDWRGLHLPWHTDKSLLMLADDTADAARSLFSTAETDPEKKQRGTSFYRSIPKSKPQPIEKREPHPSQSEAAKALTPLERRLEILLPDPFRRATLRGKIQEKVELNAIKPEDITEIIRGPEPFTYIIRTVSKDYMLTPSGRQTKE